MKLKIVNVMDKEGVQDIDIGEISVGDLLKHLKINPFNVIVMKNGVIVKEHDILTNDDRVTISGLGCC